MARADHPSRLASLAPQDEVAFGTTEDFMDFDLTEEQRLLKDSVDRFVGDR